MPQFLPIRIFDAAVGTRSLGDLLDVRELAGVSLGKTIATGEFPVGIFPKRLDPDRN
jgi:hypothetical protein